MSRRVGAVVLAFLPPALLVIACGGSTPPPAEDVAKHMADHFTKAREIEEAIIRGDIDAATAPAQWLAAHQEPAGLPLGSETYVTDMKNAARAVASTDSVGTAAVAAASMVATCGTCHTATKVVPQMPDLAVPAAAVDTASHMRQHQYAVDLLYRGLVAPSEESWMKGAEALSAAPLGETDLAKVSRETVAFEARVHELADRALTAPDRGAKVAIYGEIIGGCAGCHGLHGKVWGPGLPKTE